MIFHCGFDGFRTGHIPIHGRAVFRFLTMLCGVYAGLQIYCVALVRLGFWRRGLRRCVGGLLAGAFDSLIGDLVLRFLFLQLAQFLFNPVDQLIGLFDALLKRGMQIFEIHRAPRCQIGECILGAVHPKMVSYDECGGFCLDLTALLGREFFDIAVMQERVRQFMDGGLYGLQGREILPNDNALFTPAEITVSFAGNVLKGNGVF